MFITRFKLDLSKEKTAVALSNPCVMHGITERAFDGKRQHPLYRVEEEKDGTFLYVLSHDIPDGRSVVRQIGSEADLWTTKDYEPFLNSISDGSVFRFCLTANPVKKADLNGRKVVRSLKGENAEKEWLIKKSAENGFALDESGFKVSGEKDISFKKGEIGTVSFKRTDFSGVLAVTDAERFRKALRSGIGREKAYGMGLLMTAPYKS